MNCGPSESKRSAEHCGKRINQSGRKRKVLKIFFPRKNNFHFLKKREIIYHIIILFFLALRGSGLLKGLFRGGGGGGVIWKYKWSVKREERLHL